MISVHQIQKLGFKNDSLNIEIDGAFIQLPLDKISNKLKNATDIERAFYKISPSGYGIHWPLIDEDLSVEAILKMVK